MEMRKNGADEYGIRIGHFNDRLVELRFRAYELDTSVKSLRVVLPLLGSGFLLFSVPDFATLGAGRAQVSLLLVRLAFFLAASLAPRFISPDRPIAERELTLSALTLACVAAFGYALFAYRDQNSYLQAMSVLLMISAQYLIPNRYSFSVGVSLALTAIGLYHLFSRPEPLPVAAASAVAVDIALMALISSLVWLRVCRSRRREYARSVELERISKTDQLTGLGNRRYLEERFEEAQARMSRYGESCALILIDLDHFKNLNDDFGHEAGDDALKETARRFLGALRSEDSLSRWGGEEFIALISFASAEAAMESARRLRTALVDAPMRLVGTVRASFGVTQVRFAESLEDTVARADVALYRAKDSGRDRAEYEP